MRSTRSPLLPRRCRRGAARCAAQGAGPRPSPHLSGGGEDQGEDGHQQHKEGGASHRAGRCIDALGRRSCPFATLRRCEVKVCMQIAPRSKDAQQMLARTDRTDTNGLGTDTDGIGTDTDGQDDGQLLALQWGASNCYIATNCTSGAIVSFLSHSVSTRNPPSI